MLLNTPASDQSLDDEIDNIRQRILAHGKFLSSFFVGREDEIRLALLAACTQEPLLFVGPPGTAKSDLVGKFVESLKLEKDAYFEYMLTKFTEPSEIMGPIDIEKLKEGRFIRRTQGKLPEAQVVFLDEIFKSNSAILNTLLTVLNERKYYQDGKAQKAKLLILFGATNEIPDTDELEAMSDRFALKIETRPVKDTHFGELIDAGIKHEAYRANEQKPWLDAPASVDDFLKFKRYMDLSFGKTTSREHEKSDREEWFPDGVFAEMRRIIRTLEQEDKIFVSDRKVVKLYKLIRSSAFLNHGGRVRARDLELLCYMGNRRSELAVVRDKVRALLGIDKRQRG